MIDILFNNLSKTFLQVDALNKNKFNNLNIMKNFNLEIEHNEVVAIVGPSGIGKSTLLNILSGNDKDFIGDVTRSSDNFEAVKLATERYGGLDVFIANAGIGGDVASIEEYE